MVTLVGVPSLLWKAGAYVDERYAKATDHQALKQRVDNEVAGAKALRELQCAVSYQAEINNEVGRAASEIRTALKLVSTIVKARQGQAPDTVEVSAELSNSIEIIRQALARVEATRDRVIKDSAKGERTCP